MTLRSSKRDLWPIFWPLSSYWPRPVKFGMMMRFEFVINDLKLTLVPRSYWSDLWPLFVPRRPYVDHWPLDIAPKRLQFGFRSHTFTFWILTFDLLVFGGVPTLQIGYFWHRSNFGSLPNLLILCFDHFSKFWQVANFENFAYSTILKFWQVANTVYIAFPKISNFGMLPTFPILLVRPLAVVFRGYFCICSIF